MTAIVARARQRVFLTAVLEVLPPVPLPAVRIESFDSAAGIFTEVFALHARDGQDRFDDCPDWMMQFFIFPRLARFKHLPDLCQQCFRFGFSQFVFHNAQNFYTSKPIQSTNLFEENLQGIMLPSMKSPKTTILGLIAILSAVLNAAQALLDGSPTTNPNWELVASSVSAGFGLIFARDNNVTSEQAGLKGPVTL